MGTKRATMTGAAALVAMLAGSACAGGPARPPLDDLFGGGYVGASPAAPAGGGTGVPVGVTDVRVTADGGVLLVGSRAGGPGGTSVDLTKLTAAGVTDATFGVDGAVATNGAAAGAVAVGPTGRIAFASVETAPSAVVRVRALGERGAVAWDWTAVSDGRPVAVGVDAQDRIVLAMLAPVPDVSCTGGQQQIVVTRLTAGGAPDAAFGTAGSVRSACLTPSPLPVPRSVVVSGARILVSTAAGTPGVLSVDDTGTAVTTFVALGADATVRSRLAPVAGGGFVIGECTSTTTGRLHRFDGAGVPLADFGPGGSVDTAICPRGVGRDLLGRTVTSGLGAAVERYGDDGAADTAASRAPLTGSLEAMDLDVDALGRAVVAVHAASCSVAGYTAAACDGDGVVRLAVDSLNPVQPTRILDTRSGGARMNAGVEFDIQLQGRFGLPDSGVGAVVLNVTATDTTGPGYITVWPAGEPRPTASNLNVGAAGQTIPNLVVVPVAGGAVSVFVQPGANLVVDLAGWFPGGSVLQPVVPTRVLDTRPEYRVGYQGAKPAAGQTVHLALAGVAGLPATGVGAVVMNVTATDATAPGFLTVWPSGLAQPTASNLNVERAGQTIPNLVVVPVGADGGVDLYTQSGTHLIADVAGWFPTSRLFTPVTPRRVLDTRPSASVGYTGAKPAAGAVVTLKVTGSGDVPATGVGAVVLNVTATEASAPGFVTVWPAGTAQPTASNLNVERAGQTIPNLVVVPVGADGSVSFFTQTGTHLIADVAGWFPA